MRNMNTMGCAWRTSLTRPSRSQSAETSTPLRQARTSSAPLRSIEAYDLDPVGTFAGGIFVEELQRAGRRIDRVYRNGLRFFPGDDHETSLGIDGEASRLSFGGR